MRRFLGYFLSVVFVLSCSESDGFHGVELSPTPVSEVQNLYGVITLPTLRLREAPNSESSIVTVLVRGTIVEIETIDPRDLNIEGTEGRWMKLRYKGRRGWGFGGYIKLYESLEAARKGVENLRQEDELG